MLCQKCHKNVATVRYAEVVDGRVVDQHLCSSCMAQHQKNAAKGFELTGPSVLGARVAKKRVLADLERAQHTCPSCGTKLSTVFDDGEVGCNICFTAFREELEPILHSLHRDTRHKGRVAQIDDNRARLREDLTTKRALLRSVLKSENYEEAAALRDEIRNLESGLYFSDSGVD